MKKLMKVFAYREFSVFLILLVEMLAFYLIIEIWFGRGEYFVTWDNIMLILRYSSFYAIAAVGAAMIIISAGIDLSPGSVMALTSVVTGYFYVNAGWPLFPACLMGLVVGLVCGAFASFMIVEIKLPAALQNKLPRRLATPLQNFLGIQLPPFIATLGIMGIARGLAYIIMRGRTYIDLSAKMPRDMEILGYRLLDILNVSPIILMFGIALAFHWFMTRTRWGRQIHAVGGNEVAARFSGVKVARMKTIVYICGGVLSAIGGLILAVVMGQGQQSLALGYELDVIAAAVVGGASLTGGRGSVLGAVFGALIFGVLHNGLNMITGASSYERFIVGLAVVVIVIIDLFTARRQAKLA
jgi:ribose/xylose/arabinose/galactoside ABC-type transport system permease subunit